VLIYALLAMFW